MSTAKYVSGDSLLVATQWGRLRLFIGFVLPEVITIPIFLRGLRKARHGRPTVVVRTARTYAHQIL